jgi:hypothetical protein
MAMDCSPFVPARPAAQKLRRARSRVATLVLIAACAIGPAPTATRRAALGSGPSYGPPAISEPPNLAAIDRLIWVPGLDAGWDPQGLAFGQGSLFVSAYQSRSTRSHRGPCRVFRIDPETGNQTGNFDVPAPCGHAGGLAYAGGELFVADTHTLFEADLDQAFRHGRPVVRVHPLGPRLKGAFAISDDAAIWIGDYEQNGQAEAFKFTVSTIEALADGATLTAEAASLAVPIPDYAQGGAIDPARGLWITRSDIGWGFLDQLEPKNGMLAKRFAAPAGIEGMTFDGRGRLWAVSEAGARHLPWRYPFFPLIFRLDPARLTPAE